MKFSCDETATGQQYIDRLQKLFTADGNVAFSCFVVSGTLKTNEQKHVKS